MQTLWNKYLKKYPPEETEVYELKICKQKRLPFSSVQPHQREALEQVEEGHFVWKITDNPIFTGSQTRFHTKKPFDSFCFVRAKAYVVFFWYVPRKPKYFYKIPIRRFLELEAGHTHKSLTEQDAERVGIKYFIEPSKLDKP